MTACVVRILSTSSLDSSPSLLLIPPQNTTTNKNTNNHSHRKGSSSSSSNSNHKIQKRRNHILVECGEGTQRQFLEHGQKLSSVSAVCLTHFSHSTLGGLPGLVLTESMMMSMSSGNGSHDTVSPQQRTLADINNINNARQRLDIYGPNRTQDFIASLDRFVRSKSMIPKIANMKASNNYQVQQLDLTLPDQQKDYQREHQMENPSLNNLSSWIRVHEGPTPQQQSYQGSSGASKSSESHSNKNDHSGFAIQSFAFQTSRTAVDAKNCHRTKRVRPLSQEMEVKDSSATVQSYDAVSHRHQQQQQSQSSSHPPPQQLGYYFTTSSIPGKFLPHQATQLGVPKGPMWGQLKSGASVTISAATVVVVHSAQVTEPSTPGVGVLVLFYETQARAHEILASNDWFDIMSQQPSSSEEAQVHPASSPSVDTEGRAAVVLELVVHLTPNQDWIQGFIDDCPPHVEHIWLSTDPTNASTSSLSSSSPSSSPLDDDNDYGTPFRSAALGGETRHALCPSIYSSVLPASATAFASVSFSLSSAHPQLPAGQSSQVSFSSASSSSNRQKSTQVLQARTMMEYRLIPRNQRGWKMAASPSPFAEQSSVVLAAREIQHEATAAATSAATAAELEECSPHHHARISPDPIIPSTPSTSTTTPQHSQKQEKEGSLLFTGTGAAMPCKHRNVTGMCLTAHNGNRMLLDAGEGTIGQLLQILWHDPRNPTVLTHTHNDTINDNNSKAGFIRSVLKSIRCVWISHLHADHHLGMLRLLEERYASDPPLLLIAPACVLEFFRTFISCLPLSDAGCTCKYQSILSTDLQIAEFQAGIRFTNPSAPASSPNRNSIQISVRRDMERIFDWTNVSTFPVTHCIDSFAIILDGTPFGRLVYSGDCRPSSRLARIASPANVLIHDSTFEDGMELDAQKKKHSTVSEAIHVATEMNATYVVLTHFSQRYPRIAPLPNSSASSLLNPSSSSSSLSSSSNPNVIFAFDYMRLHPSTLTKASLLTDVVRLLYPSTPDDSLEAALLHDESSEMGIPCD